MREQGRLIVPSKSSAPATPSAGEVYYNTTDGNFYMYDGVASAWIDCSIQSNSGGGSIVSLIENNNVAVATPASGRAALWTEDGSSLKLISDTGVTVTVGPMAMSTARVTANQTFATTTPANITNLAFPVVVGADYSFEFWIPWSTGTAGVTAFFGLASWRCPGIRS
jgi:hypothetical protein